MKLAVLSDIHGNYTALKTCLDYIFQEKADAFIFLGDYVGELAYPRRTMELLYELNAKYTCYFIKGNKEDYWLDYRGTPEPERKWKEADSTTGMLYYAYQQLEERDMQFFESLQPSREILFEGEGLPSLTICHGSPENVKQKLLPNDGKTIAVLQKCPTGIILCGHTHIQGEICYKEGKSAGNERTGTNKCIYNPGAVGTPLESDGKTQFMLLHGENAQWTPEFVSLEYDVEQVIKELYEERLFEKAPGWCKVTERMLREGKPSHGEVLARAMKLCKEATGVCNWPEIPEEYWEQAIEEMLY